MRVVIGDDHRLFADAVRVLLTEHGFEVVAVATDAASTIAAARRERPDLVLVDLGLPDDDGVNVGKKVLDELPSTRVIALTANSDASVVRDAMRAGFHGYVTKDAAAARLITAIRSALDGEVVIPHRLASGIAGALSEEAARARRYRDQLTPREIEVLTMLAEGGATKEIARALSVSPNTVRTHVQNLLTKLDAHSRLELATWAVRHGVVRLEGDRRFA